MRFPFESENVVDKKDVNSWGDFLRPLQTSSHTVKRLIFMRLLVAFVNTCSRSPRALSATSQHYKNRTKCEKVHYKVLFLSDPNIQEFVDTFMTAFFSFVSLLPPPNPTYSFQAGLWGKDFLFSVKI